MATTSRGWRKVSDNEQDKAQAVNDALDDASADLTAVAATIGNAGGGVPQGDVSVVNVAANAIGWTDSGVVFDGEDALWLEASGTISHNGTDAPYGPLHSGGAYLVWALINDGSTPSGDVGGQNDFRSRCTAYRKSGRLWLRIRDVGGSGDNVGAFAVKVHCFDDPSQALAPLGEIGALRDALAALTVRVAALEAAQ